MRARLTIFVVISILIGACSTDGPTDTQPSLISPLPTASSPPTVKWGPCSWGPADCAVIEVPVDYDDSGLGTFDLLVARHRARKPSERIGVLFTNAGGPGAESIWLAIDPRWNFSDVVLDRFDIVGWDPRGTSGSRPKFDCTDDIDAYFSLDPTPETPSERMAIVAAARSFVDSCIQNVGDLLAHVGTADAARDIDFVRRLLGEERASYLGYSYGSELGATWVTMFPDTVHAAVFDAAADPTLDLVDWLTFQSIGFERSLEAFLDECDENGCEFVTGLDDARSVFDRLMSDLAHFPLVVDGDRPPVGEGVAQIAVFNALYRKESWVLLDQALAEAARGYGDRLLSLYDSYFGGWRDGHPDDSIDSYVAITCLDRQADLTVDDAFRAMDNLALVSPRLGASVLYELLLCAHWPIEPTPPPDVEWSGATPLLVVGSTGDPATPLEGTRRMRDVLANARLVVVESFDHTSYGADDCATRTVDDYLIDPTRSAGDVDC